MNEQVQGNHKTKSPNYKYRRGDKVIILPDNLPMHSGIAVAI